MQRKLTTIGFSIFTSLGMLVAPVYADDSYSVSTASGTWVKVSDKSYTMDIDGDGETDITLTKNGNKWTYQFNVSKANQDYYVYEEMMEELQNKGYKVSGSDGNEGSKGDPGVIKGSEGKSTYTLTNTKKYDKQTYGSLKITEKVVDADGNPISDDETSFTVTIKLTADTEALQKKLEGVQIFGDVAFKDGVGKVTLSNNKSITIPNIPTGIKYSIKEDPVSTYTSEWSDNKEGYIVTDSTTSVVCTNKLKYVPDKDPGNFTIKAKADAIAEDMDDSYIFHVSLDGLNSNESYSYKKYDSSGNENGEIKYKANSTGNAVVDVTLKHGEYAKFNNLKEGTTYQISEDAGKYLSSYKIKQQSDAGEIAKDSDQSTQTNQPLNTAQETVESEEDVLIIFTNTYQYTQSLKITTKTAKQSLLGLVDYDTDEDFEITVKFSGMEPGTYFESTLGAIKADEDGEATKTFTIKNGETVEFTDIPEKVQYKIKETGTEDWVGSYQMTGQKVVVQSSGKGSISGDVSTEDETVDRGENVTVAFTNYQPLILPATGGIGIGVAAVGGACLMVVANKKKKKGGFLK